MGRGLRLSPNRLSGNTLCLTLKTRGLRFVPENPMLRAPEARLQVSPRQRRGLVVRKKSSTEGATQAPLSQRAGVAPTALSPYLSYPTASPWANLPSRLTALRELQPI